MAVRKHLAEHLPGHATGWEAARLLGIEAERAYWQSVNISVFSDTSAKDVEYAVQRLLEFQRPRSAFEYVGYIPEKITPGLWKQVLEAILRGDEPDGPLLKGYHLEEIFKCMDYDPAISDDQIAFLELHFFTAIRGYGVRTGDRSLVLYRQLNIDPDLFTQILSWLYRRRDGAVEPELEKMSEEQRQFYAEIAYEVFAGWEIIPGMDKNGRFDPAHFKWWVMEALNRATKADRRDMALSHLGELLGKVAYRLPSDDWLPDEILDLLDDPAHEILLDRFCTGLFNARGVVTRDPYTGGTQERELSRHYRNIGGRYRISYPRLSSKLLEFAEGYDSHARRQDGRSALRERWEY